MGGTGASLCAHEARDGKGRYTYSRCVKPGNYCSRPRPNTRFSMLHAEKRKAGDEITGQHYLVMVVIPIDADVDTCEDIEL